MPVYNVRIEFDVCIGGKDYEDAENAVEINFSEIIENLSIDNCDVSVDNNPINLESRCPQRDWTEDCLPYLSESLDMDENYQSKTIREIIDYENSLISSSDENQMLFENVLVDEKKLLNDLRKFLMKPVPGEMTDEQIKNLKIEIKP